jgi:hypothetical protein
MERTCIIHTYGDAVFISLNSEDPDDYQYKWL